MLSSLCNLFFRYTSYNQIAESLRDGSQLIEVKYRWVDDPRYYFGTGAVERIGFGKWARYAVKVGRFDYDHEIQEDGIKRWRWIGNVSKTPEELNMVLSSSIISSIEHKSQGHSIPQVIEYLTNIVRRLKPGQGYKLDEFIISSDFIHSEGFIFHKGNRKILIPSELMGTAIVTKAFTMDLPFDPSRVFVKDETKIKRHHRSSTDPMRWIILEQLKSVDTDWTFKMVHVMTGGGPVRYYRLKIDIDNKEMKGYPFHINHLIDKAKDILYAKYPKHKLECNLDNVSIIWDGRTELVNSWVERVKKYPAVVDSEPLIIYSKPLIVVDEFNQRYFV